MPCKRLMQGNRNQHTKQAHVFSKTWQAGRQRRQPFRQFAERDNGSPHGCTVLAVRSQLAGGEGVAALARAGLRRIVQPAGDQGADHGATLTNRRRNGMIFAVNLSGRRRETGAGIGAGSRGGGSGFPLKCFGRLALHAGQTRRLAKM